MWVPSWHELRPFSPELGLIATIVVLLIVPLFVGRRPQPSAAITLVGALFVLLLTGRVSRGPRGVVESGLAGMSPAAPYMLLLDNFAVFFKLFLMLFLALVTWLWLVGLSARSPRRGQFAPPQQGPPEFFVLLVTSALGMALMVSTLNLLLIVIAVEMASLPSYAIVASDKRSRPGAEAALKYVLFGAATAAIMVYGVSLLYGYFGTLDLPTIAINLANAEKNPGVVVMLALFALGVGIAFKISAVPFHFWCPDVFQGAPIEVTTWLSVASKAAGLGLLLRIVHAFATAVAQNVPPDPSRIMPFIYGIGIAAAVTCTFGNLAAMRQNSVKRILAYSSIAHAGYMMMAGAIFLSPPEIFNLGIRALIAYLFIYLLMNLGAFSVTAMVAWRSGTDQLSAFSGLGRRAPWLALPMAVCLFSLIGLPPLGGFAAKWWLLWALGRAAALQPWLWWLVVIAAVNTAISLYFYVRIIRQMYLVDDPDQPRVRAPLGGLAMVNACAVLLLLLGTVFFQPLGERSKSYAMNLFGAPTVEEYERPEPLPGPSSTGGTDEPPANASDRYRRPNVSLLLNKNLSRVGDGGPSL